MEPKHPLADCNNCPLQDDGRFVPSLFPKGQARLAVVGEAPGVQEAAYKVPFKGPSGKLLDEVLNHVGYQRTEVMYTNACLCRPPNNATPPKTAINACRARLYSELNASGVQDVVALGATATSILVDDSRTITSIRVGPPKKPTVRLAESNIKRVIATWHPAFCLRNADAFPSFVSDMEKLKRSGVSTWTAPDWRAFEDPNSALEAISELRRLQPKRIAVDIEAGIEKDYSFGHPNEYDLLCIGISYAKGKVVVIGETALKEQKVIQALKELFATTAIAAHNGKFDLGGLYPTFGELKLGADTMLKSYVRDERPGGHALETLSIEQLGSPSWKYEIGKYIKKGDSYANIPRPILYQYNAYDVHNTYLLDEHLSVGMEEIPPHWPYTEHPNLMHHAPKSAMDLHNFLCRASNPLMFLELNGIPIDRKYSDELVETFLDRIDPIESEINRIVQDSTKDQEIKRVKLNPRSPKQIKEYLASQGVRVDATNKDTLNALRPRLRPGSGVQAFVESLLEHRRQQKLYSTYVVGIRKRLYRGRVYTTYLLHGSTSGRLASRNPNLQNIVRDKPIRRQFVPSKPENIFIQADYKQAEARVITTLARDEYLRSVLSDSTRDIFDDLCNQIYGPNKWNKEGRIRIKAFFYGIGYGRTPYSIAQEFKMHINEANKLYRSLTDLIPTTMEWQNSIKAQVSRGEDLLTTFGRRRRFWLITDQNQKDVFNEALSFVPQSTASDICLSSLIRLRPMLRGIGFIRLTIHDALVAEAHRDREQEVSELLKSVMVEEGTKWTNYVPFPVDISTGLSWGDL